MKKEKLMLRLLEWLLHELEGEFARIQKERENQEEFFLSLMEEIQRMLDQK
jgi:hypothetical protein